MEFELLTRRDALRLGAAAAGGLCLPPLPRGTVPRAKAVIQVWMWGGPSHLDTFDPKPAAGYDYCGALRKPIATKVDGVFISELLPELAKLADKYALLRSLTHGINGHETAAYNVQTGRKRGRDVFPSAGAVVSRFKGYDAGYKGLIPPYIVLTTPQGRFSEAGFLGLRYKPFATGGDPAAQRFLVEGIVARGITDARQRARRGLLGDLNTLAHVLEHDGQIKALAGCERDAYELFLGDSGKVFDLGQEPAKVRERYGRTTFGQSCLMARRLVEKGVPYVTINYRGWDTHKRHFQIMQRKLPEFDHGLASLIADLDERGLLDQTVVWCCGEFGRTPKVLWQPPWNGGRGHWGRVFSALVAGGGFKGGHVIGASDDHGLDVAERPIAPVELLAAIYGRLQIPGGAALPHPQGKKVTVLPSGTTRTPLREIV